MVPATAFSDVSVTVNEKGIPSMNPIVVAQGEQDIEWTGANGVTNLKIEFKDKGNSKWHGKVDKQISNPDCPGGRDSCKLPKDRHKGFDKECWDNGGSTKKKSEFCVFEYTITGTAPDGTAINVDPVIIVTPYP